MCSLRRIVIPIHPASIKQMTIEDIPQMRLKNQGISDRRFKTVKEVISWMGAMQAQDYNASLWAVGLRVKNCAPKMVEDALAKREIIRLSPMRGTVHFVAREDARWMHALLTPRLNANYNTRSTHLGITPEILKKSEQLAIKALKGGKQIKRTDFYKILEDAGISTKNSVGLHIIGRLSHDGLICNGCRDSGRPTMVLFDEWVPKTKELTHDEAITKLTLTYFTSHGPAQIKDLNWWSGLSMKDIKRGIELNGKKLTKETVEGKDYYFASNQPKIKPDTSAHLLPAFDEYVVAYRDREAFLEEVHKNKINPGANGVLSPTVVISGQVVGNWKKIIKKGKVEVVPEPFVKFSKEDDGLLQNSATSYKNFSK